MAKQKDLLASEVDVSAITAALRAEKPARITVKDVLESLQEVLLAQRARGLTVAQLADILSAHGVEMTERQMSAHLAEVDLTAARMKEAPRKNGDDPGVAGLADRAQVSKALRGNGDDPSRGIAAAAVPSSLPKS